MFRCARIAWEGSGITSKLSERPLKLAGQKLERGKMLIPEYSTDRDQPTSRASPLRINDLLSRVSSTFSLRYHSGCHNRREALRLQTQELQFLSRRFLLRARSVPFRELEAPQATPPRCLAAKSAFLCQTCRNRG